MINLDADAIRQSLGQAAEASLARCESFAEIESTNSYLMQQAAPPPGQLHAAVTDNQTRGRGRHGRTWQSPPGSGLCLSIAYTFVGQPRDLPALTLAIGLGVAETLDALGVGGVQLKWPNDLIAGDGKLGGILTETISPGTGAVTIVTGIGLNVDLGKGSDIGLDTQGALPAADLASLAETVPPGDILAARLIDTLHATFVEFESNGFERYAARWSARDWLLGRELTIATPRQQVTGVGAGVADDGALLLDAGSGVVHRITSGSVMMAGIRETRA